MAHNPNAPCAPCAIATNPARFSSGYRSAIVGGGIPVFNGEDGAIGSSPTDANFLSQLQRMLQDKGLAPAKLYGFDPNSPQPWYRPDLAQSPDAQTASWSDYVDGVNMGTYRGGVMGLAVGAAVMLAALYFGGAMVSSPKPEASGPNVATSRHRSRRKGR